MNWQPNFKDVCSEQGVPSLAPALRLQPFPRGRGRNWRSVLNVTELLSAKAHETPDAPAVLTAETSLSFAELDRAVSWIAGSLRKAGVTPGDAVGIQLHNQIQHLITSLALARLGAGQFSFENSDPPRHHAELARRLNLAAIVSDKSSSSEIRTPIIDPPPGSLLEFKGLAPVDLPATADGDLPFLFTRSSGTTGVSKLGLLTHAVGLKRLNLASRDLYYGHANRFLPMSRINFTGVKLEVFRWLMAGRCLALHDGSGGPQTLIEFILAHKINYLASVPVQVEMFLKFAKENAILFPDVEAFRISSTLVRETLRTKIQEHLTPNLYLHCGITEVGTVTIARPALVRSVPGVIGEVLPGMRAEVIDEEDKPLPPGKTGRLRLRSAGMISGYIDDPDETARSFRDGWFYSSDAAEFTRNGELIHHGRADDLMILDGINIFPAEIENVLLKHPAVAEAAAFPVRSEERGDIPVAAVVTKSQVSVDELHAHCQSWLGARSPLGLMILSRLPRNAAQKVLKNELAAEFQRRLQQTKRS